MINPRTVPHTPQRLAAIKQEFIRPLSNVIQTPFSFAAISSDSIKETPQVTLEIERVTTAENVLLVPKNTQSAKLSSIIETKSFIDKEPKKRFTIYLPYIIGGVIVTLAIYFYLQSRITKEKEEPNSAQL